jgi:putative transposase
MHSWFGLIRQHFALKRHVIRASLYRKQLAARFVARREFAELAQNSSPAFWPVVTPAVKCYTEHCST